MKKISFFFYTLFLCFGIIACKKSSQELIIGKWIFDLETAQKLSQQETAGLNKESMKALEDMFKAFSFEFKKDGTLEMSLMGQTQKGFWSISNDGKTLTFKGENGKSSNSEILKLSKDKLTFKMEGKVIALKRKS